MNPNGHPPAIDLLNQRSLKADAVIDVFQPFAVFDPWVTLSHLRYTLLFMHNGHDAPPVPFTADEVVTAEVFPRAYAAPTECLPLAGPLLVHDGHDFYSHHRRFDLARAYAGHLGEAASPNLYAVDLVTVAPDATLFHGSQSVTTDWLTYGAEVTAPEAGTVIDSADDVPENRYMPDGSIDYTPDTGANINGMGNHVAIRYEDGRVGWLLHLQPRSVAVHTGDRVATGQKIGRVGFSGDSLFPHLHYNVTETAHYPSQGVPTYFRGFNRIIGSRFLFVQFGPIDTGDIVEASPGACR